MEQRTIGSLSASLVGIGCNNFGMRIDEGRTKEVVDAALDEGINFFDTADVYGSGKSEEFLGKALGSRRDDAVIATKFGAPTGESDESWGASPKYIAKAVEKSLSRLGTDYIDLYQQHIPDANTPVEDTLEALNELVRAGKVREIGHSNFSGEMIEGAEKAARDKSLARFVSAQNNYSLLERTPEQGVTQACERLGLRMLPYFPLASGLLTGKYKGPEQLPEGSRLALFKQASPDRAAHFLTDDNFAKVRALEAFASERGRTLLELAMSWLAAQPSVASVIAGATSGDQVRANVAATTWKMSDEDLEGVDRALAE